MYFTLKSRFSQCQFRDLAGDLEFGARAPPLHSGKGEILCLGQAFSTAWRGIGVPYNTEVYNVFGILAIENSNEARARRVDTPRKDVHVNLA